MGIGLSLTSQTEFEKKQGGEDIFLKLKVHEHGLITNIFLKEILKNFHDTVRKKKQPKVNDHISTTNEPIPEIFFSQM